MHRYLRAVGFSNIQKREEVEALAASPVSVIRQKRLQSMQREKIIPNAARNLQNTWGCWSAVPMMIMINTGWTTAFLILQGMLNGSMKTWRSRDMQKKSLIQDFVMISIWERR